MWTCKYCLYENKDWSSQCRNPDCLISRRLAEASLNQTTLHVISLAVKGLSFEQVEEESGLSGVTIRDLFRKAMEELNVESIWEVIPTAHKTLGLLKLEDLN